MSNTRISVEHSHREGFWLASVDMDLGDGQRFLFNYLTPIDPQQTIAGMDKYLIREAHRILGEMIQAQ